VRSATLILLFPVSEISRIQKLSVYPTR